MAISLASSGSNYGSTATSVTSLSVTAGQLICVVVAMDYTSAQTPQAGDLTKDAGGATIGTPTLDKYLVFNTGNAPYYCGLAFYSVLVTGTGSLSLLVAPTGTSAVVASHVSIWNGTWDSTRVESAPTINSSATDNQTSFASNSATSAGAALFLAGLGVIQTVNNTITKDAAYTLLTSYQDGTTQPVSGAAYKLAGSGATNTSTWTAAAASNYGWASGQVVYKEVAAAAAPTISSGTSTSITNTGATIGASTDQTSGTGYVVVDTAANLSGVTATQIKAGQKASGTAALASGNTTVSASPFSVAITGLSPTTSYSYAIVQNNTNGDSNVLTGTFSTQTALSVTAGTIQFAGQDVTLIPTGNVVLPVTSSSLVFEGSDVAYIYGVNWSEGTISFVGQDVALVAGGSESLTVTEATLTFTGQDINIGGTATLSVSEGTLTFTGQNVTLTAAINVVPVTEATLTFSGQDIVLRDSQAIPYTGSRLSVVQISPTGKVQWKDYIPIKYQSLSGTADINRTDDSGALAVTTLSSGSGLVEWKDYKPVVVVVYPDSGKWRYDDTGFIPVVEVS